MKEDLALAQPAFKRLAQLLEDEKQSIFTEIEDDFNLETHKVRVGELKALTTLLNFIKVT